MWLLVLERWRLTIDQWESLPWWQQEAYLKAHNRKVARENAQQEQQAAEQERQAAEARRSPGKVAGRKGGKTKLRDSPLWEGRKTPPAVMPRMTGRPPPGVGGGQPPATPPSGAPVRGGLGVPQQ